VSTDRDPSEGKGAQRGPRTANAAPPSDPHRIKRPWRRLWCAYTTTTVILLSYGWAALRCQIASPAGASELLEATHRRNAQRIKASIARLQGLFIKVGQLISIMANALPAAYQEELEELQDRVPPRPYSDIEASILEEFGGQAPASLFESFEEVPVASASIGQVHRARLLSGEAVAVKVQYPDIEAIVRIDLRAIKRIFRVLAWVFSDSTFVTMYEEIRAMVLAELDYRQEADSMVSIAEQFAERDDVRIPQVVQDRSTSRVLTTEWIDGVKMAAHSSLDELQLDRRAVAELFVDAFCQQIFVNGHYHADPHPGNLMVERLPDGRPCIIFLDFGATGRVSEKMRKGLLGFLQGAVTRDTGRIVSAMKEMGFVSRRADMEVFDRVVSYFHEKLRADVQVDGFSLKDIKLDARSNLASLIDLRDMNVSLGDLKDAFVVPRDWVLLERALLLLLGVCTALAPEIHPAAVVAPYLERFLGGEKADGFSETALETSRQAALAALSLPTEMQRVLAQIEHGRIEVGARGLNESARLLYLGIQQLLWGALGGASFLAELYLEENNSPRAIYARTAAVVFGVLLVNCLWSGRKLRKKLSR